MSGWDLNPGWQIGSDRRIRRSSRLFFYFDNSIYFVLIEHQRSIFDANAHFFARLHIFPEPRMRPLSGREPCYSGYGGGSCSEGCGFESQISILDGHFFTLIFCKNCKCLFEKIGNKQKEAEDGPFLKKVWGRNREICEIRTISKQM